MSMFGDAVVPAALRAGRERDVGDGGGPHPHPDDAGDDGRLGDRCAARAAARVPRRRDGGRRAHGRRNVPADPPERCTRASSSSASTWCSSASAWASASCRRRSPRRTRSTSRAWASRPASSTSPASSAARSASRSLASVMLNSLTGKLQTAFPGSHLDANTLLAPTKSTPIPAGAGPVVRHAFSELVAPDVRDDVRDRRVWGS